MVASEKNFQNGNSHMAGKRYFEIGFANILFERFVTLLSYEIIS